MRILVSWYAKNNDFAASDPQKPQLRDEVNPQGPTLQFHRYFYKEYDRHVLLTTRREEAQDVFLDKLVRTLHREHPGREIETRFMDVPDVISYPDIKPKIEALLLEYRDAEIDIFFSPGTSVMQVTWFVCHQSLGLRTRLLQTREGKFSGKIEPELIELKIEQSDVPRSVILAEQKQQSAVARTDYHIGGSIAPVYEKARLVAQTDRVTCLIRGESGTGKEHLARYLHQQSSRTGKPFVAINCSALTDSLLESRLFGYLKWAFTDAREDKKGLFEEAQGGVIFLDEIGDITPMMQQSLLRVLQSAEILPIGATQARKVDVRVVAATHRDLEAMCSAGAFRWDLYYRLSVVELTLPTLQERGPDEKKELLNFFLAKIQKELNKPHRLKLSREARQYLLDYPYPGNIRELENVITNLYVFCEEEVQPNDLPARLTRPQGEGVTTFNWQETEKDLIRRALDYHKGNQRQACRALGYGSINTLRKKVGEYGV